MNCKVTTYPKTKCRNPKKERSRRRRKPKRKNLKKKEEVKEKGLNFTPIMFLE